MSDESAAPGPTLGPIACHPAVVLRQLAADEKAVPVPENFGKLAPDEVMQLVFALLSAGRPSLIPVVGDYGLYDQLSYFLMTHDQARKREYERALALAAPGKTVVDIGTGRDLNWALAAIEAGAAKVYAIEAMRESFEHAQATIATRGLEGRITLLHGRSTEVSLPEPADVCVSEIIGCIGTAEGVLPVLRDARARLLKPGGVMIPGHLATVATLYSLPEALRDRPGFEAISAYYATQIFNELGRAFDVRLVLDGHQRGVRLSDTQAVEDVDLSDVREASFTRRFRLEVGADGLADGLLCSIKLRCHPETEIIDSLNASQAWIPAFLPLFSPAVEVRAGDVFEATWHTISSDQRVEPDYRVVGRLSRPGREDVEVDFSAPFVETRRGSSPLYQGLIRPPA
ncbi:MAG: hypothetical protein Tsb0020_38490 [Haliangiales bacterium]